MTTLVPLTVAVPLLTAAAVGAVYRFVPRRVPDALGIAAAASVAVMAAILLLHSQARPLVYWFGGWRPRDGIALGISFAVDPIGAGLALLAAVLVTASFVFSWRYFEEVGALFHVLVLVFLAAMVGFALTGDLFNMFVFFELLSTAAFALTAYRVEEAGPVQGAINFAVTNGCGAILVLTGIALLYGRTGALNMAQIGQALSAQKPDGLIVTAFVLLAVGWLVKAAAVPFHFWLADAYAVAPTPVCVLFSGVMSDLGLYAIARLHWTIFAGPFGAHEHALRGILLGIALLTALLGGAMAFLQANLKRLLAYVTIAHGGIFLAGIALLTPRGLAGTALYVVADGLVKGALFLGVGILAYRLGRADELELHGRGRLLPVVGVIFVAGGLGLAGIPPFGTFLGKSLIEEAASEVGLGWVAVVLTAASILTGGSVLRAAGRVFLGLGPTSDALLAQTGDSGAGEEPRALRHRNAALMALPAIALLALGLGLSFLPRLAGRAEHQAARFEDRPAYAAIVLRGEPPPPLRRAEPHHTSGASFLYGAASTLGALALAGCALARGGAAERARRRVTRAARRPVAGLHLLHSGHVGDYVAWLTAGAATLGGLCAVFLR